VFDLPADALERPALGAEGADGRAGSPGAGEPADSVAPALRVFEGETVYDYAWYPGMLASEPATCVFASTSRVRAARAPRPAGCTGAQAGRALGPCTGWAQSAPRARARRRTRCASGTR